MDAPDLRRAVGPPGRQRQVRQMTKDGTVEIAPLAYMRGRTNSRSFVIMDEAQNMTSSRSRCC